MSITRRPRVEVAGEVEEILQDRVAVLGRDALGVELHAVHRVASCAADPMIRPSSVVGGDLESSAGRVSRLTISEW